jgi:hypothetical protein
MAVGLPANGRDERSVAGPPRVTPGAPIAGLVPHTNAAGLD